MMILLPWREPGTHAHLPTHPPLEQVEPGHEVPHFPLMSDAVHPLARLLHPPPRALQAGASRQGDEGGPQAHRKRSESEGIWASPKHSLRSLNGSQLTCLHSRLTSVSLSSGTAPPSQGTQRLFFRPMRLAMASGGQHGGGGEGGGVARGQRHSGTAPVGPELRPPPLPPPLPGKR